MVLLEALWNDYEKPSPLFVMTDEGENVVLRGVSNSNSIFFRNN